MAAASEWGGPAEVFQLDPALFESFEWAFHKFKGPDFFLILNGDPRVAAEFERKRLERAVGVVYDPRPEQAGHCYFGASLARQFDAVIHIDQTQAAVPLDPPQKRRGRD